MPYRRRKTTKRPIRRRARRVRRKTINNVARFNRPFARSAFVKLRYVQRITLEPTAGGVADSHFFRCNSLYDPDYTGVGHQPIGFDEYANLYKHYTVYGAKINVKLFSVGAAAAPDTQVCVLRLQDDVTVPGNYTDMLENPQCNYRILTDSDNGGRTSLTKTFSLKRTFPSYKTQTGLGADVSTNPTNVHYFGIHAFPLDATQDGGTVQALVTIEYLALMTEAITLLQS